jgi:ABC-2 type transport system permease protein
MNTLTLGAARTGIELKEFFRLRENVVLAFGLPVILLFAFGAVFDHDLAPGVSFPQYAAAGMIATGLVLTSFQTLAVGIAVERDDGSLKRLRGTPMPPLAYFLGKFGLVLVTSVAQTAVLLALGRLMLGLDLPAEPAVWLRFAWLFGLGVAAGTALGIACSSLARSAKTAAALVSPVVLVLQCVSGVFFVFTELPGWMQAVGSVFPLRWLSQGMRSVFLPDGFAASEAGGSWQLLPAALILTTWAAIGMLLALRTFRWQRHDAG